MNLTQFINTYNGKKVDYKDKQFKGDGSYQCVDLARQYVHDVFGVDQFPALGADGGAKDIFDKCTNLKKTVDSPTADYDKGDILIWDKSKTNKYGNKLRAVLSVGKRQCDGDCDPYTALCIEYYGNVFGVVDWHYECSVRFSKDRFGINQASYRVPLCGESRGRFDMDYFKKYLKSCLRQYGCPLLSTKFISIV